MARVRVQVLNTAKPTASLAAWLAGNHPDVFLAMVQKAKQAKAQKAVQMGWLRGFGRLSQDDSGVTTSFDAPDTFDTTATTTVDTGVDLSSDPTLQTIEFDSSTQSLPDNLLGANSALTQQIGDSQTSSGSTVSNSLGGSSGVLSALGSVAGYLTSSQGLTALAGVAKTYFQSQGQIAQAQAQQQVVATQIARAAANQAAAPITYATNSAGQLVPVYATNTPQGTVYQPITSTAVASLAPSNLSVLLSQYGIWILAAGALALAIA